MDISAIEQYIDRIYGFAVKHTFTRDEADELSQEILFTAVKNFPKLCDHSRFEPWLWGIAKNTAKMFSRRAGKMRALYVYDLPESMPAEAEENTVLQLEGVALGTVPHDEVLVGVALVELDKLDAVVVFLAHNRPGQPARAEGLAHARCTLQNYIFLVLQHSNQCVILALRHVDFV